MWAGLNRHDVWQNGPDIALNGLSRVNGGERTGHCRDFGQESAAGSDRAVPCWQLADNGRFCAAKAARQSDGTGERA
tara:strand:+ start:2747 stop:2977 length:231 start_codon:yes stop_codon:yes gene_type:complete